MTVDRQYYDLDQVRDFKRALGAFIEHLEHDPITIDGETGEWERKVNLRPKGLTLHMKWKPDVRLLAADDPSVPAVQHLMDLGLQPGLTWQLLDQLDALMSARAAAADREVK